MKIAKAVFLTEDRFFLYSHIFLQKPLNADIQRLRKNDNFKVLYQTGLPFKAGHAGITNIHSPALKHGDKILLLDALFFAQLFNFRSDDIFITERCFSWFRHAHHPTRSIFSYRIEIMRKSQYNNFNANYGVYVGDAMKRRCFFIGHANTSDAILPALCSAIRGIIEEGDVREFYVGNHGSFDALVCRTLKEMKQKYPEISCFLVAAYHPGAAKIGLPQGFDGIYYPLERSVPPRFALPKANRAMIDRCGVLIAAVNHPGRSREVLEYAQRREARGLIRTVNLLADKE